nr:endo-polygalacturonase [uncultured bacterium]
MRAASGYSHHVFVRVSRRTAVQGFLLIACVAALPVTRAYAQDTRDVKEPRIPQSCVTLTASLRSADGKLAEADEATLDTQRIQMALDSCAAGKAVELKAAPGRDAFLSGPLQLRSGVTLLLDGGVTLFASRNPREYDTRPGACGVISAGGGGCRPLIGGTRVEGAGVMGDGIIDGRGGETMLGATPSGTTWWQLADRARAGGTQNNPRILVLNGCDNFTLYRITLRNSPNFHVSYNGGNGFTVWGVKVYSPKHARNTDGIDPGNSTNVTIAYSWIDTGDDNVAIKAGAGLPTTHMTIAHNHFYSGHGMSIGSETNGGASAFRVSDLSIDGADNGIRIKSNSTRGGLVHDVVYEDVCIRNTKNPIFMDTHYTATVSREQGRLPIFQDITLRNVRIAGEGRLLLDGLDAEHLLKMTFDNVMLDEPASVKTTASHARVILGPGPVNFRPEGENVVVSGNPSAGSPNSCAGKFVPFPR